MIFLSANGLRGPFEGPVAKNRDFVGPLNGYEQSKCHFGAKKVEICKSFACSHLRGQKSQNFQGQALQMALVIYLYAENHYVWGTECTGYICEQEKV